MKTVDSELSMGCSVGPTTCNKCDRVPENYVYTKTNQKSQEWFPHGENEKMRFDYVNVDKDGSFSIAYTVRKKNAGTL